MFNLKIPHDGSTTKMYQVFDVDGTFDNPKTVW